MYGFDYISLYRVCQISDKIQKQKQCWEFETNLIIINEILYLDEIYLLYFYIVNCIIDTIFNSNFQIIFIRKIDEK